LFSLPAPQNLLHQLTNQIQDLRLENDILRQQLLLGGIAPNAYNNPAAALSGRGGVTLTPVKLVKAPGAGGLLQAHATPGDTSLMEDAPSQSGDQEQAAPGVEDEPPLSPLGLMPPAHAADAVIPEQDAADYPAGVKPRRLSDSPMGGAPRENQADSTVYNDEMAFEVPGAGSTEGQHGMVTALYATVDEQGRPIFVPRPAGGSGGERGHTDAHQVAMASLVQQGGGDSIYYVPAGLGPNAMVDVGGQAFNIIPQMQGHSQPPFAQAFTQGGQGPYRTLSPGPFRSLSPGTHQGQFAGYVDGMGNPDPHFDQHMLHQQHPQAAGGTQHMQGMPQQVTLPAGQVQAQRRTASRELVRGPDNQLYVMETQEVSAPPGMMMPPAGQQQQQQFTPNGQMQMQATMTPLAPSGGGSLTAPLRSSLTTSMQPLGAQHGHVLHMLPMQQQAGMQGAQSPADAQSFLQPQGPPAGLGQFRPQAGHAYAQPGHTQAQMVIQSNGGHVSAPAAFNESGRPLSGDDRRALQQRQADGDVASNHGVSAALPRRNDAGYGGVQPHGGENGHSDMGATSDIGGGGSLAGEPLGPGDVEGARVPRSEMIAQPQSGRQIRHDNPSYRGEPSVVDDGGEQASTQRRAMQQQQQLLEHTQQQVKQLQDAQQQVQQLQQFQNAQQQVQQAQQMAQQRQQQEHQHQQQQRQSTPGGSSHSQQHRLVYHHQSAPPFSGAKGDTLQSAMMQPLGSTQQQARHGSFFVQQGTAGQAFVGMQPGHSVGAMQMQASAYNLFGQPYGLGGAAGGAGGDGGGGGYAGGGPLGAAAGGGAGPATQYINYGPGFAPAPALPHGFVLAAPDGRAGGSSSNVNLGNAAGAGGNTVGGGPNTLVYGADRSSYVYDEAGNAYLAQTHGGARVNLQRQSTPVQGASDPSGLAYYVDGTAIMAGNTRVMGGSSMFITAEGGDEDEVENDDITIGIDDAAVGLGVPPPGVGYSTGGGGQSRRSASVTSGEGGGGMPGAMTAADAASDIMSTHTVQEDQDDAGGNAFRLYHQQQRLQQQQQQQQQHQLQHHQQQVQQQQRQQRTSSASVPTSDAGSHHVSRRATAHNMAVPTAAAPLSNGVPDVQPYSFDGAGGAVPDASHPLALVNKGMSAPSEGGLTFHGTGAVYSRDTAAWAAAAAAAGSGGGNVPAYAANHQDSASSTPVPSIIDGVVGLGNGTLMAGNMGVVSESGSVYGPAATVTHPLSPPGMYGGDGDGGSNAGTGNGDGSGNGGAGGGDGNGGVGSGWQNENLVGNVSAAAPQKVSHVAMHQSLPGNTMPGDLARGDASDGVYYRQAQHHQRGPMVSSYSVDAASGAPVGPGAEPPVSNWGASDGGNGGGAV
jgi:hypothetical protein